MEFIFENIKHFLLPVGVAISGSLAKFLLGAHSPKKIKDWLTFIVFALFLMVIIKLAMNVVIEFLPNYESVIDEVTNLLYAMSSLVSREVLLILIARMPDKIADRILSTIDMKPQR